MSHVGHCVLSVQFPQWLCSFSRCRSDMGSHPARCALLAILCWGLAQSAHTDYRCAVWHSDSVTVPPSHPPRPAPGHSLVHSERCVRQRHRHSQCLTTISDGATVFTGTVSHDQNVPMFWHVLARLFDWPKMPESLFFICVELS